MTSRPKIAALVPFCPLPVDTGGKREMWKHLEILSGIGECTILSAAARPVGAGWTPERRREIEGRGFRVILREETQRRGAKQWLGILYAAFFKGLGLEGAFGHSNPYHRSAFPVRWWRRNTGDADLAVINFSFWADLPCSCPKCVVLLDLQSDVMWESAEREVRDMAGCDAIFVISVDEEAALRDMGLTNVVWSPPCVERTEHPLTPAVGMVASENRFNVEGLRWLEKGAAASGLDVRVYGSLARHAGADGFVPVGAYGEDDEPYRECGIVLLPTSGGTGVQIKAVEALAAGRAIVARKGAMRGLPKKGDAWTEVTRAAEMVDEVKRLRDNGDARRKLGSSARKYYEDFLNSTTIWRRTKGVYTSLLERETR